MLRRCRCTSPRRSAWETQAPRKSHPLHLRGDPLFSALPSSVEYDPDGGAATRARVSVIVPSYNHASYVATCIGSILDQTRPPDELVVIDDGSTDDSAAVIEFALREATVPARLVVRPNRGLAATLNEGLSLTTGDFVAYLGSDDFWFPEFLAARVLTLQQRSEAVLAYGNAFTVDEDGHTVGCTADWATYTDGDAAAMLLTGQAPTSSTVVYRGEALRQYGWNEAARLEDYELYLRLSVDGAFAFAPEVLAAWRRHSKNTSGDIDMMLEECLSAQTRLADVLALSPKESARARAALRWRLADSHLLAGRRRAALAMSAQGLRGATSPAAAFRRAGRLVLPVGVLRRRVSRLERRAARRYALP